jgi:hypothetical protein
MHNSSVRRQKPVRMIHLNFDRLRATRHSLILPPWFVTELAPLLSRGQGAVPASPDVVLSVARGFDCAQFLVSIRGDEYLTGGVAWGSRDRRSLYAFLVGYYEKSKGSSFPGNRPMPSGLPCVGTVGSPGFAHVPRLLQAQLLAWSRRLAAAIINHALSLG